MGPTWVLSAPDGPHVGPMNLTIRGNLLKKDIHDMQSYLFRPKKSYIYWGWGGYTNSHISSLYVRWLLCIIWRKSTVWQQDHTASVIPLRRIVPLNISYKTSIGTVMGELYRADDVYRQFPVSIILTLQGIQPNGPDSWDPSKLLT